MRFKFAHDFLVVGKRLFEKQIEDYSCVKSV